MIVLVIVLVVTNVAALAVLVRIRLRLLEHPRPSGTIASALDASTAPPELSTTATRRVISIEILNPIELAGTRGRLAGLAGVLVPGITTRVVHDQAIRTVRRLLVDEGVRADVRLHTIRPAAPQTSTRGTVERDAPAETAQEDTVRTIPTSTPADAEPTDRGEGTTDLS